MGKKDRKRKHRGGRPRKIGERYPNGRLKQGRDQAVSVVGSSSISPTTVHRIREHARALGLDPRLGTELGRLVLFEQITSLEAAAGFRMAEVYGRFERQHGRRRATKSPSYEIGFGGRGGDNEEDNAEKPFMALQEHLKVFPPRARDELERLCVDDQPIGPAGLSDVRAMLTRMGKDHFKMQAAAFATGAATSQARDPGTRIGAIAARASFAVTRRNFAESSADPVTRNRERLLTLLQRAVKGNLLAETLAQVQAVLDRARFNDEVQRRQALVPSD